METLLTREEFREATFKRDGNKCVMCKNPATEVHHVLDRKLFPDGGYYISNGVSVDSDCHKLAENCVISVEELREAAKITNPVLPPDFLQGVVYDKWGNVADFNTKYPRSLHAQISLGTTSDDRFMPDGYVKLFSEMNLIITEKLDGQNVSFNKQGVYARSHAAPTEHPWDKTMIELWHQIKYDLGDIELFGESMYAVHSIEYKNLENHFYLFGVRENGVWKSWDEVKEYAILFDFPTVPEIKIEKPLKEFYLYSEEENNCLSRWLQYNLKMSWEEYVETSGTLGGFDPLTGKDCCEGFVIRNANYFKINNGVLPVAANEFDSLFKLVRKKHVTTNSHWTKNWRRSKLNFENQYGQ